MNLINSITDYPFQQQQIVLPDGSKFFLQIRYVPLQSGWFITNLTYGSFVLQGVRITNRPNILFQWSNVLPFGLKCVTAGGREPTQQEDFSSGASKIYLLSKTEVVQLQESISNAIA